MAKNKTGMILIIVLLIVLLLTIGVGFFFIFKNLNSNKEANVIVVNESIAIEDIYLFEIEDAIYTNLIIGEDNKTHVIKLKVNLGLDYSDKKTKESDVLVAVLTEKKAVIKDSILSILRSKTYEDLISIDTQALLKEEILSKLKEEFKTDLIVKVYIDDLILQ